MSLEFIEIEWGGKPLSLETGRIAGSTDGSVLVKFGDTTVLCTVVYEKKSLSNPSFFPLTVNYQEKFFASGKIPGGFMKREGKPSDREVLISRMIDRSVRPLFHRDFFNETQIICTTLSYDENGSPGIAAIIGSSAALAISGIPFDGPVASCNVGYSKEGEFLLNQKEASDLYMTVSGTSDGILMVECESMELSEDILIDGIMFAFSSFQPVVSMISEFKNRAGKPEFKHSSLKSANGDLFDSMKSFIEPKMKEAILIKDNKNRNHETNKLKEQVISRFSDCNDEFTIRYLFEDIFKEAIRHHIATTKTRMDGRGFSEVRNVSCDVGVLPIVHGSSIFTRGGTQVIVVVTLGSPDEVQVLDDILGGKARYFLHYNFPPYSVGEVGRLGSPGRREIGHGNLALRATNPVIPSDSQFPYTIRLVSEVTSSNGSSSMATVCGASLSMMDAGIPISSAVSGIAMGLVIVSQDDFLILSDISGDEDHFGDMDLKIAGTKNGVTALQMDIKVSGVTKEILTRVLLQARDGRAEILETMEKTISQSREVLSPLAPRFEKVQIDVGQIKELIGAGGKTIKGICEKTQSKIDIAEDGCVSIFSNNEDNLRKAVNMVKDTLSIPETGKIVKGKVVNITDFGAFIDIGFSKDGLLHISNISNQRVNRVDEVLSVGQIVKVKIIEVDAKGRIKLSMKFDENQAS
jgi:polyribonucleotide nucleotidyltransferase